MLISSSSSAASTEYFSYQEFLSSVFSCFILSINSLNLKKKKKFSASVSRLETRQDKTCSSQDLPSLFQPKLVLLHHDLYGTATAIYSPQMQPNIREGGRKVANGRPSAKTRGREHKESEASFTTQTETKRKKERLKDVCLKPVRQEKPLYSRLS